MTRRDRERQQLAAAVAAHLRAEGGDLLAALRAFAAEVEAVLIRDAFERHSWNLSRASAELGLTTKSLLQAALKARHPELEAQRQRLGPPDRRRKIPT